jgi:hypothetical protein
MIKVERGFLGGVATPPNLPASGASSTEIGMSWWKSA